MITDDDQPNTASIPLPPGGRDRLRELLDAVLADEHRSLDEMADGAFSSPFHFSRRLKRDAGESPVAMRRRVLLERAAWNLRHGTSVTEAALAAGYDSVDGFARAFAKAFGCPPSAISEQGSHWLPAPNGIHFHPPMSLWVDASESNHERSAGNVLALLVEHDLDDVRSLLDGAKGLSTEQYRAERLAGNVTLAWDGPEASIADVLNNLVHSKEVWTASIVGADVPARRTSDASELLARHDAVAPRWLAVVRDIDRRGASNDRLIDALCDPPESFVLGSVLAHVLTYAAHRRQLARVMLRAAGVAVDHGDPIEWLQTGVAGDSFTN